MSRRDTDPHRGSRRIPLAWHSAADELGLNDEPAAPAAEAGDELRAEIARWWAGRHALCDLDYRYADEILALPALQRLVAEAAEAARLRAAVQRVEAAIDRHADNLTATQRRAFHRAMDGDRG